MGFALLHLHTSNVVDFVHAGEKISQRQRGYVTFVLSKETSMVQSISQEYLQEYLERNLAHLKLLKIAKISTTNDTHISCYYPTLKLHTSD